MIFYFCRELGRMNHWLELSIEYANQRSYLDDLFTIYPAIPEGIREIDQELWQEVETAFSKRRCKRLIRLLLRFEKFPIQDPYVAYLKRDPTAIDINPRTVRRLCGRLYEMGLSEIYKQCTEPKEINRQIGPMFRNWLRKGSLGLPLLEMNKFLNSQEDAILDGSDKELKDFAHKYCGYNRDKGLDLVVRIRNKYIIGEAKFLTDFGGHQYAQLSDALRIFESFSKRKKIVPVAILDGVLYIRGNNKMYRTITSPKYKQKNIFSALLLRDFIYSTN